MSELNPDRIYDSTYELKPWPLLLVVIFLHLHTVAYQHKL